MYRQIKKLSTILFFSFMFCLSTGCEETSDSPSPLRALGGANNNGSNDVCSGSSISSSAEVLNAVNNFISTLSSEQKVAVTKPLTETNARHWSNFPAPVFPRQGLQYSTLSEAQLNAALQVQATALSASGCHLFEEIRKADDELHKLEPQTFGSGNYYIAVLGTPSATTPWMLQMTGHHIAYNIMYNGNAVSGTPMFDGVEPLRWTDQAGATHAPLESQRSAVQALAQTVQADPNLKSGATLSGTFTDIVNGAKNQGYDGPPTYPTTGRGLKVSDLSPTQRNQVNAVIEAWVNNMPANISESLLADYESNAALNETYVGIGLNSSGTADFSESPNGLSSQNSYLRIDGPRVWIEFVVQPGASIKTSVHYHTVWRDKTADYGAEFQQ
jgi:hypothetical protein